MPESVWGSPMKLHPTLRHIYFTGERIVPTVVYQLPMYSSIAGKPAETPTAAAVENLEPLTGLLLLTHCMSAFVCLGVPVCCGVPKPFAGSSSRTLAEELGLCYENIPNKVTSIHET